MVQAHCDPIMDQETVEVNLFGGFISTVACCFAFQIFHATLGEVEEEEEVWVLVLVIC